MVRSGVVRGLTHVRSHAGNESTYGAAQEKRSAKGRGYVIRTRLCFRNDPYAPACRRMKSAQIEA